MTREWSPRWPKRTVESIKKQIEDWLKANGFTHDLTVYTQEEWFNRGEKWWENTVVTIAAEGPFYHMMNYGETRHDRQMAEKFRAFLDQLGLWYEQGYSWTWHIYRKPETGPIMGNTGEKKPLLTLLSSIAFTKPKLVLMQGRNWFRIEELIRQARRDAATSAAAKEALEAPIYSAEEDPDRKLVIWRDAAGGRKATFVEPGSTIATEP